MPVIKYITESGEHECEVIAKLDDYYRIRDTSGNVLEVCAEKMIFPRFADYMFA